MPDSATNQTTPPQFTNAQQQTAQPQASAVTPPSNSVQTDSPATGRFHSQPFESVGVGLASALTHNPVSSITITFIAAIIIVLLFIINIVVAAATLFGGGFGETPGFASILLSFALFVVGILVLIRAIAATVTLYIASHNGETITGRQAIFNRSSEKIGAFLLASVIYIVAIIAGLIVFILPGLFLLVRFGLYPFVIYDEKLSAVKSLKRSWQLTRGHFFETASAIVAESFIVSGGLLVSVASFSGSANRYFEYKSLESGTLTRTKVHWLNYVLPFAGILLTIAFVILQVIPFMNSSSQSQGFDNSGFEYQYNSDYDNNFNDFNSSQDFDPFNSDPIRTETDFQ